MWLKFLKNLKLLDDNHAVGNTSLVTPLLELPTFLGCTSHILEYPFYPTSFLVPSPVKNLCFFEDLSFLGLPFWNPRPPPPPRPPPVQGNIEYLSFCPVIWIGSPTPSPASGWDPLTRVLGGRQGEGVGDPIQTTGQNSVNLYSIITLRPPPPSLLRCFSSDCCLPKSHP